VSAIATNKGPLSDQEFETVAARFFRATGGINTLPAPDQVERCLRRYRIAAPQRDWARAVAQRALTKLLVGI
jgi:hypothetical protein